MMIFHDIGADGPSGTVSNHISDDGAILLFCALLQPKQRETAT
jgi:hypothetical protein